MKNNLKAKSAVKKTKIQRISRWLRNLLQLKKRLRQSVSLILITNILFGALFFDLEALKAWGQSGSCGGPDQIFQDCALGGGQVEADLTNQAVDDVISMYKLPVSDRSAVLHSMRNEVRGMLFIRLLDLIKKPNKTSDEEQALAVFNNRVKSLRIRAANEARNEYIRWTQDPCGGYVPPAPYTYSSPGCTRFTLMMNGAPTSPSYEEFVQFGTAIAYQGLYTNDGKVVSEKTSLAIANTFSAAAVGVAGGVGAVVGTNLTIGTLQLVIPFLAQDLWTLAPGAQVVNGWVAPTLKIPAALSESSGWVGGSVAGGVAAVVIAAIAILTTQTIQVVNQRAVPDKLAQAIIDAQNATIDLNALRQTDVGIGELYSNFIFATLPDFPAPLAPAPSSEDRKFVIHIPDTGQTFENQSVTASLGWSEQVLGSFRLSGSLFAYSDANNPQERLTLLIRYKDWDGKNKTAYRVGGQFFVADPVNYTTATLENELRIMVGNQKFSIRIKFTQMELFNVALTPSHCGTTVTPDPGADTVIGRVSDAGEAPSSLIATINGDSTATVDNVTVRNLRINSNYEVIANILSTNAPAPTTAVFELKVKNSVNQEKSAPVVVKKTAVKNTLPEQTLHRIPLGQPFEIEVGSSFEINCSAQQFSVIGDLPPGLKIENVGITPVIALRGTPTSAGKYNFIFRKSYSNGESIEQSYNFLITTDLVKMDDSAVSWWRAEDGAADYLKRADGTIVGSVGFNAGKVNRGFNFDGSNSHIKLPENTFSPGNDFTFETWFKTDTEGVILGREMGEVYGNSQGAGSLIYVDHNGKLRVQMFRDAQNRFTTSESRVDDNQYHHVAVTSSWQTQTRKVYLDGEEIGSFTGAQYPSLKYQFGTGYVSDAARGGTDGWLNFKGVIDEPTLYSRVLDATDIKKIFGAGSVGKLYFKARAYAPSYRDGNDGGLLLNAQSSTPVTYKLRWQNPIIQTAEQETGGFLNLKPTSYQVTIEDSYGLQYTTSVNLPNAPANLTVTSVSESPQCFGAQTGTMRVLINGGSVPFGSNYQYSVLGGANPSVSNIFSNLSGGSYTPAVIDADTNTLYTGEQVTLTQPAPFAVSPGGFANAQQNVPYSQTFTLSGNTAPYTLVAEGNDINNNYDLPDGLAATVSPDKITISGTPTVGGTYPIRILYYDRNSCPGSKTMNLTVAAAGNVSIGGRVTNGGQGLPNATVILTGGADRTTTTDAAGSYTFLNLPPNQDYTVTTTLTGYTFAEPSRNFSAVNANIGDGDFLTAFTHYEGDIAPRSSGDGSVDVRDFITLRRIRANQESLPANGGEWQRASVNPRSQLGSTVLIQSDETQLLRYLLRLDPLTLVGGPSQSNMFAEKETAVEDSSDKTPVVEDIVEKNGNSSLSEIVSSVGISSGSVSVSNGAASLPVNFTSDGTAVAVQFTVNYDASKLTLSSVTNSNSTFNEVFSNTSTPGQITVVAYRRVGVIPAFITTGELLRLNFTANQGATGISPIDFTDTPIQRLAADANANAVTLNSSPGRVVITAPPTAATVSIAGRVFSAAGNSISRARVSLTLPNGETKTTQTNSFGNYRFDNLPVGSIYVVAVNYREIVFSPQVVNLVEAVENLDFRSANDF